MRDPMRELNVIIYAGQGHYNKKTITNYSCRKNRLKRGSFYNIHDFYNVIYEPCRTGGADNSGCRAWGIMISKKEES